MSSKFIITQHVPGFVEGCEPKQVVVKSKEDIYDIPWIKSLMRDFDGRPFNCIEITKNYIMGYWNSDKSFYWVLGYIKEGD